MFGIAKDIRSEVRECTPDLLNQVLDSAHVVRVCAEIEDALEKCRRGEITKEEYETLKSQLKKRLPIFTFHATFKNGRRKNGKAIPSGLSIYDLDHIGNPQEKWTAIEPRAKELGIVLAHISPSLEGLRLVFVMPGGMDLAQSPHRFWRGMRKTNGNCRGGRTGSRTTFGCLKSCCSKRGLRRSCGIMRVLCANCPI